jgi:hypothetical protein
VTNKKKQSSKVLQEVRQPKYRQRIIPDKKKEQKKYPPVED